MSPEVVALLRDWSPGIFILALIAILTAGSAAEAFAKRRRCTHGEREGESR